MEAIAFKFVKWDVPELESLKDCKVYRLRMKVLNNEKLNREEKNWITYEVNNNRFFRTAIPLQGWCFDFINVLRPYLVRQYGHWQEYHATDRTALRTVLYGRIEKIVDA